MDLQVQIKALKYLLRLMNGEIDKMPHAKYTPQKEKYYIRAANTAFFNRVPPASQGVPAEQVEALFRGLAGERGVNAHSLLLLRHGHVIAEGYWSPYRPDYAHITHSMCKSIVSMAIGIGAGEGILALNETVADIFPDLITLFTPKNVKSITIQHLLTMSSGSKFNELNSLLEDDWLKGYLETDTSFEPGSRFEYNSLNTYVLGAILRQKTGQSLCEYLKPRLFDPLGIDPVHWEQCPMGREKGGWGLLLLPEDMAKLGQLYLQQGRWQGQQLIPKDWVRDSTKVQIHQKIDPTTTGYGYQIWTLEDGAFLFNGMFGQSVYVFPEQDMVIVLTSGAQNFLPEGKATPYIQRFMQGVASSNPPSLDSERAMDSLRFTQSHLTYGRPIPEYMPEARPSLFKVIQRRLKPTKKIDSARTVLPDWAAALHGKTLQLLSPCGSLFPFMLQCMHNNFSSGLESISFAVEGDALLMECVEGETVNRIPIGIGLPHYGDCSIKRDIYTVGSQVWKTIDEDENPVLIFTISFIEMSNTRIIKLFLEPDPIHVEMDEEPSMTEALRNLSMGMLESMKEKIPFKKNQEYLLYRIERLMAPRAEASWKE